MDKESPDNLMTSYLDAVEGLAVIDNAADGVRVALVTLEFAINGDYNPEVILSALRVAHAHLDRLAPVSLTLHSYCAEAAETRSAYRQAMDTIAGLSSGTAPSIN